MSSDADIVPPLQPLGIEPVGGLIRADHADFRVTEIPLYEPGGEGEHLYVEVTRDGMTTRAVQKALAAALGVPPQSVGYAGMKDKGGRCTQRFSLTTPRDADEVAAHLEAGTTGLEKRVLGRHGNKLRRGHLIGNRFRVVVREPEDGDAAERAGRILALLAADGVPNWYGLQRFGVDRENVTRARRVLAGERPPSRWLADVWLSAWQSALFNGWLAGRMDDVRRVFAGDVVKKTESGGLFTVEEPDVDQPRLDGGELVVTGPMFGSRMRAAEGEPGVVESSLLEEEGVTAADLGRVRLSGARRAALLFPTETSVTADGDAVVVEFTLPKGGYATTVLREIIGRRDLV